MISKMTIKMNLRITTKNHAADPEKRFLAKSISKSNGCTTGMPTALELKAYKDRLFWVWYRRVKDLNFEFVFWLENFKRLILPFD